MSALRYTVLGSDALERSIGALVAEAGRRIEDSVPAAALRAVLLIGGYGRGEGGVDRSEGGERAHNNLDFLVVLTPLGQLLAGPIKKQIDAALAPLAERARVGLDTGMVGELSLAMAPRRVMWCDARLGHRVVVGDPAFVARLLARFDRPEQEDVGALLVNRTTLLVINDLLAARAPASVRRDRAMVRHAMKAIVGVGDAWLATRDLYHPSYLEKRARLRASGEAPAALLALYERAIAFRLEPDYAPFASMDLGQWTTELRRTIAPLHLEIERALLDAPTADWRELSTLALREPRAGLLRSALPAALYGLPLGERPRSLLGLSEASTPREIGDAYLALWSRDADANFDASMSALGVVTAHTAARAA